MKGSASIHSIFTLVYYVIMMQYCISVLEKIATGAIHSGLVYRTGIQCRMHVNTPIEKLWEQTFFFHYQYTVLVYRISIQYRMHVNAT